MFQFFPCSGPQLLFLPQRPVATHQEKGQAKDLQSLHLLFHLLFHLFFYLPFQKVPAPTVEVELFFPQQRVSAPILPGNRPFS